MLNFLVYKFGIMAKMGTGRVRFRSQFLWLRSPLACVGLKRRKC